MDCGIADVVEAEILKKHKIDLIITDHHEPSKILPEALAVIDAKREDSKYPNKDLCGAGVAFKLVQAIIVKIKSQKNLSHLTQTNYSKDISGILSLEMKELIKEFLGGFSIGSFEA